MFTFEQIMTPVWNTDIIYGESLTMFEENGVAEAPLMFKADEIIKVESADMINTYEEGKDYIFKDNKIILTKESRIFCFKYSDLYFDEKIMGASFAKEGGGYSLFHEKHFFHDRQIAVTYKCKNGQWKGHTPVFASQLKRTYKKLTEDKKLNVTLFGDSISVGANSSGKRCTTPFQPPYGDLVCEKLSRHYDATVVLSNPSVGGKSSVWGAEVANELVNKTNPDLVIIAFGMNDRDEGEYFVKRIEKIRDIILEKNPECEFIVVATSLPNPILNTQENLFWRYQYQYKDVLKNLECDNTAMANITDMQKECLKTKRFIDMTGNNVNHPNDFFHRLYANYISSMLIKD